MIQRVVLCVAVCLSSMTAQPPRTPDLPAQRAAMQKLSFIVGKWSVEAQVFPAAGGTLRLDWSEDAQYKLDGLLLEIEANGRNKADNKVVRQALGFVSYDDFAGAYRMRTYNDGTFPEDLWPMGGQGRIRTTSGGKEM